MGIPDREKRKMFKVFSDGNFGQGGKSIKSSKPF